jgi:hypothetical protein
MNNNGPVIVSLPLSRGWKKAERMIEDVAPTKFPTGVTTKRQQHFAHSDCDSGSSSTLTQQSSLPQNESSGGEQQLRDRHLCLVCLENKARYTCPRCQTPYCSIECYRNHTNTASSTATNTESESITNKSNFHSCTEDFFKRKVTSLMQLESLEQEEKAHRALNRYHHENSSQQDFQEPLEGYNNEIENLYELQSQLEILENNNKELSHKELAKLLPPSLKAMFEKDLHTGQLQAEWVLNRWYPWWKPELIWNGKESERDESSFDANNEACKDNSSTFSKTLDERLLRVPNYESFGGTKSTLATVKNKNDDVLVCNLLDILYATCRTLRLYHGVENASRQEPVEAASTLISTSAVLGKDTRFTTIYQVLNHHCNCTTETLTSSSTNNSKNRKGLNNELANANISDDPVNWDVCIEDITSLVTSPRMVGRALLEASDILKAAIKELKFDQSNTKIKKKESKNDDDETKLKQIRRLRKKLQFFLSWATRHPVAVNLLKGGGPKEEVLAWIDERKQIFLEYECSEDNNSSSLHRDNTNNMKTLTLHPSGSISTTKSSHSSSAYNGRDSNSISESKMEQPLLVEVQSRRKK